MTLSSDPVVRVGPTRSGRVLRGTAVEHAQPATLHVERPRSTASTRRRSVAEELAAARQEGFDEGFTAGMEAGSTSAQETRHEALQRAGESLRQAASAIEAGRANAVAVVEEDAATLAVELARALVDHELSLSDDDVTAAVRRALRLTAPGEDLVIRLHPDDVIDEAELQPFVTDCRITVVADRSIEPGGCVVDAGPCRIDAQIAPALARVRWALLAAGGGANLSDAEPPPVRVGDADRSAS
jgi:flagellar assembly protein FliH